MSELIGFVERHPWWTLVYLALIAEALSGLIRVNVTRQR